MPDRRYETLVLLHPDLGEPAAKELAEGVARDRAQPEAHGPRPPLRVGASGRECAADAAASRRRAPARARGTRVRGRRRVRGPERGGPLVWQNGSAASAGGRARGGGSAAGAWGGGRSAASAPTRAC